MKRNIAFISGSSLLLLLASSFSTASAQTVVISQTDRGWYSETGFHDPTNLNYLVGDTRDTFCQSGCLNDYRNFFVFDLSEVTQPIASATLAAYVPPPLIGYRSSDPSENYDLHDVVTPIGSLVDGTGGIAAHADLGSGVVYGSRTMTAADMGLVVEITLNSSAIAAMNSTHGLFGFGGSITTLDDLPNDEFTFGRTSSNSLTELRLTFVPEPTSAALFASAAMIFGMQRSRKRSI